MTMINHDRMTDTVLDLIRIDSHSKEEKDVAAYLVRALTDAGCDVRVDDAGEKVGANTGNVIARLPGTKQDAAPLLLSAHMDTVPPGKGVKPVREAGRIRTDGTTVLGGDDKSGLAIILEAIRVLGERSIPRGDIDVVFTICEEIGLLGAKHFDVAGVKSRQGIVLDSNDASLLYTITPRVQLQVQGLNLNNAVFGFFQGSPSHDFAIQREYYGRTIYMGAKYGL